MTTIDEAIDAIYDAKAGRIRDLGGAPVTEDPKTWPIRGDLIQRFDGIVKIADGPPRSMADWNGWRVVRRAEQPEPDLIYFPWPSGIDGIIGVIGPRGKIQSGVRFSNYERNGDIGHDFVIHDGPINQRVFDKDGNTVTFRFPADADLIWVRDESEVPADLLREARERDA